VYDGRNVASSTSSGAPQSAMWVRPWSSASDPAPTQLHAPTSWTRSPDGPQSHTGADRCDRRPVAGSTAWTTQQGAVSPAGVGSVNEVWSSASANSASKSSRPDRRTG
jgi:hypothetical protein